MILHFPACLTTPADKKMGRWTNVTAMFSPALVFFLVYICSVLDLDVSDTELIMSSAPFLAVAGDTVQERRRRRRAMTDYEQE